MSETITRAWLAERLGEIGDNVDSEHEQACSLASDELRKVCGSCRFFEKCSGKSPRHPDGFAYVICHKRNVAVYEYDNTESLPMDGTGFCHQWQSHVVA